MRDQEPLKREADASMLGASEIDPALHARVNAGLYPHQNFWRVGRKVGRTIYAQIGHEPSDDDPLIGMMDTPALAADACEAHNARLTPWGLSDGS